VINVKTGVEKTAFLQSCWTKEKDQDGKGRKKIAKHQSFASVSRAVRVPTGMDVLNPGDITSSTDRCRKLGKSHTANLRLTAMPSARKIKVKLK